MKTVNYFRFAVVAIATACAFSASAQNAATSQQQSTSAASNLGNAQQITVNEAGTSPLTHATTDGSLKTTGTAIAPGIYNSSGTYACFGGASIAAGWMGGAVSGGTTVGQNDCYRMHLLDKALAARQGKVYDALFCQFPDGKAAYEAAGLQCPTAPQKRAEAPAATVTAQAVTCETASDPIVKERLCRTGR